MFLIHLPCCGVNAIEFTLCMHLDVPNCGLNALLYGLDLVLDLLIFSLDLRAYFGHHFYLTASFRYCLHCIPGGTGNIKPIELAFDLKGAILKPMGPNPFH